MTTLDELRDLIRARRDLAEKATAGPWSVTYISEASVPNAMIDRWYVMGCFDGNPHNPTGPAAMCEYEPDAAHIAVVDPATVIRNCDEDLWLLDCANWLPEIRWASIVAIRDSIARRYGEELLVNRAAR